MKRFIQKAVAITLSLIAACIFMSPAIVAAQAQQPSAASQNPNAKAVCEGVGISGGQCDPTTAQSSISGIVSTVIKVLSMLVGVVSVIMIMIGGFKYITSTGDSNSVNSAKNTILYALVGLVIAALAQGIVAFVLTKI